MLGVWDWGGFFFSHALYGMVVAKYLFVGGVTLTELMKIGRW